jgi:hypothetical protein
MTFNTSKGTVPKKSNYACGACGTVQDALETIKATAKTGPVAAYVVQGYILRRFATPSALGAWSDEVLDTKLAK